MVQFRLLISAHAGSRSARPVRHSNLRIADQQFERSEHANGERVIVLSSPAANSRSRDGGIIGEADAGLYRPVRLDFGIPGIKRY